MNIYAHPTLLHNKKKTTTTFWSDSLVCRFF